jgi:hypothetical protein
MRTQQQVHRINDMMIPDVHAAAKHFSSVGGATSSAPSTSSMCQCSTHITACAEKASEAGFNAPL